MKLQTLKTTKLLATIFILTLFFLFPFHTPSAGKMTIENGTTFTDTFTKDGRTVEVKKTYTYDKVTIHQKIWDEEGNLIRDKITEKDIGPNITIVGEDSPDNNIDPSKEEVEEPEEVVKPAPTSEDINNFESGVTKFVEEKDDGLEKLVETVQKIENLETVDNVYVSNPQSSVDENAQVTIEGTKRHRLLGLFFVSTNEKLTYDVSSWQLLNKQRTFIQKFVELLSTE